MSGDSYKRRFRGNVAQCGCRWIQAPEGDRLLECIFHAEATKANVQRFEASRGIKGHRFDKVIIDEPQKLDLRLKETLMGQSDRVWDNHWEETRTKPGEQDFKREILGKYVPVERDERGHFPNCYTEGCEKTRCRDAK